MKILYFSPSESPHTLRFLSELVKTDNKIYYVSLGGASANFGDFPWGIERIEWYGTGKRLPETDAHLFSYLPLLDDIVSKVKPDIIHAEGLEDCAFLAYMLRVPYLAVSMGSDVLNLSMKPAMTKWKVSLAVFGASMVLCDCWSIVNKVKQICQRKTEDFRVMPYGIVIPNNLERRKFNYDWIRPYIILSTRSWDYVHGTMTTLEAFKLAYQKEKTLRLILMGDGSSRGDVTRFIRENKLGDVVYCPGTIPDKDIAKYHKAADLFISTPITDGVSVSFLEAMFYEESIVISDLPPYKEWKDFGATLFRAAPNDAGAFAHNILFCQSELDTTYNSKNRSIVEDKADFSQHIQDIIPEAYEKIYASRREN